MPHPNDFAVALRHHEHRLRELEGGHHTRRSQRTDGMGSLSENLLDKGTQYEKDWFTYLAQFASIAAGVTATTQIQIQADTAFELMQLNATGFISGAVEPFTENVILPMRLMLTDTGTGRQLMSDPTPLALIAGSGKLPFIIPQERIFIPKATITVQLTNFGASTYLNIALAFIGVKLFGFKS